jgi:hypothetical protein
MPGENATTVRHDRSRDDAEVRYDAQRIETKWFERWLSDASLYAAEQNSAKQK